jgi:hypothetical protein
MGTKKTKVTGKKGAGNKVVARKPLAIETVAATPIEDAAQPTLPDTTAGDAIVGRRYATAKGHEVLIKSKGRSTVMVTNGKGGPFTIAASTKLRGPITEAAAFADAAVAVVATATTEPAPRRKRDMSITELQSLYLEVVGRPTGSTSRPYIYWKVAQARKGRITVGTIKHRPSRDKGDLRVLPVTLARETTRLLDAAVKAAGARSRSAFIRAAIIALLRTGTTDAARFAADAIEADAP